MDYCKACIINSLFQQKIPHYATWVECLFFKIMICIKFANISRYGLTATIYYDKSFYIYNRRQKISNLPLSFQNRYIFEKIKMYETHQLKYNEKSQLFYHTCNNIFFKIVSKKSETSTKYIQEAQRCVNKWNIPLYISLLMCTSFCTSLF